MADDFTFKGACEPAFPMQSRNGHETFNLPVWGLTKREYLAAVAMQGMLSHGVGTASTEDVAHASVLTADALLKELNK